MEDTSFAIHPGKKSTIENATYYDMGNLISIKKDRNLFKIKCEQGYLILVFYREDIVRLIMNPSQEPVMESTFAVITSSKMISTDIEDLEDRILLKSELLTVALFKNPLRVTFYDKNGKVLVQESKKGMGYSTKNEIICFKDMNDNDHFYGFGEKTGFLDKRGEKMTMWNSDVYAPHNPEIDALYQSIPFFMTLRDGKAHGIFFDNSYKTVFDMKSSDRFYSFWAEGGQLDYYLMVGPSPKEVLEQYTYLTGRTPIPPKWALGYHQSRYSYETEQEVRELASNFLQKEIPIDAIYLDIHYMNDYRVFTFDQDRFPTPDQMISDLKNNGIHIVTIVDPGVKEDPEYVTFKEGVLNDYFCKYIDGNIYYGDVWPGNSAFPDFMNAKVRDWWGEKHRFYSEKGIDGIWNDMNEPSVFNEIKTMDNKVMHKKDGELKSHREVHNLYGLMMGEATYEGMKKLLNKNRPFLLTRAGYSGVQRYATVWTGDNRSFWEHLAMSLPMCMNLGLSGVSFIGPDVGGFAYDSTGELLARWTQVGAFYPYFRNHSALGTVRQEPWSFGEKYEKIIKKYIKLRYKWLPHFYSLFKESSKNGNPIMRPLFMEYPKDENTFNLSDQFMIGNNVIIAPILQPSTTYRSVYLPEGTWYDYWTGQAYEGAKHILIKADLDTMPIFIKAGSIIISGDEKQSTNIPSKNLEVHIYPSSTGSYDYFLYEDDGKTFNYQLGEYLEKHIKVSFAENLIDLSIKDIHNNFKPSWDDLVITFHNIDSKLNIVLNSKVITKEEVKIDDKTNIGIITFTSN